MTNRHKKHRSHLLSMYADNELSAPERIEVERLLVHSAEARKELDGLLRIKAVIGNQESPAPNDDFYSELYGRLPRPVYNSSPRPLIRRKFVPALAGLGTIALVVLVVFGTGQSGFLYQFFTKTSHDVKQAYEENVVKGWIMPLFQKTGKNEALRYAMFGVLPLDDSSHTFLKVDNSTEKGYTFELGEGSKHAYQPVTVADLYSEIQPTEEQRQALDTILSLASQQIEEGVLLDENKNLAISPSVIDLQRSLMARVAASLDRNRRVRMERFLETRNSPLAVRTTYAPTVPKSALVQQLKESGENNTYVMISPDTIQLSQLALNREKLRQQMSRVSENQRRVRIELHTVARNLYRQATNMPTAPPMGQEAQSVVVAAPENIPAAGSYSGMRVHVYYNRGNDHKFITTYIEVRQGAQPRAVSSGNVLAPSPHNAELEIGSHIDSMFMLRERAMRHMQRQLEQIEERQMRLHWEDGKVLLDLDSLERIIRVTTDSMKTELQQKRVSTQPTPTDTEVSRPEHPGVEIRPDYYERQQEEQSKDPARMIKAYKDRLRKYQSETEYIMKIKAGKPH